jgi:hypothetical protein
MARPPKYPLRTIAVGESFFAPGVTPSHICWCAKNVRPRRFSCRTVVSKGVQGVRVRRIA